MSKFKFTVLAAAAAACMVAALPAQATVIVAGTSGLPTQSFAAIAASQGVLLASTSVSGTAFTFSATMRAAVYRNTSGTLDFYYQVVRTGRGSLRGAAGNQMIDSFTGSDFTGFTVDGYASATDLDGAGFFTAANNPPSSTTTFGRSSDDAVLQTDFGINGLAGTEISAVYVFRTNARAFTEGTFGIIDGSSLSGLAYAPSAVPEPATWGMLIGGFGMVGFASRRRRAKIVAA